MPADLHEEWRPIEGWPYEVSNVGRVRRSIASAPIGPAKPGYVLKPSNHGGYLRVDLRNGRRHKIFFVHVLVATAFLGHRPSDGSEVAHQDGDPGNNVVPNIRWATKAENAADRDKHGTTARGMRHGCRKLSEHDVREIRRLGTARQVPQAELAHRYGVTPTAICKIVRRKKWAWLSDAAQEVGS